MNERETARRNIPNKRIAYLYQQGIKPSAIAKDVGCNYKHVVNVIEHLKENKS